MARFKLMSVATLCTLLVALVPEVVFAQREAGPSPAQMNRPGREEPRVAGRVPEGNGWLGVQLAPVPAAVAAQLQIEPGGVMIRNLFEGSPADKAGLQRYDVVVALDGRSLDEGVELFSRLVRQRKEGDTIDLKLFRGGQKTNVSVILAAPPEQLDTRSLKYEDDAESADRRILGLRGKILRPGPEGWILDDLGELPQLPEFDQFFKREHREPGQGRSDSDHRREAEVEHADRQGGIVHLRMNRDGSIEVRRYKSGTPRDEAEPQTFANWDELKKADPQAADLLRSATSRPAEPDLRQFRKPGDLHEEWRKQQESLRQYKDALEDYIKRYQNRVAPRVPAPPNAPQWREWRERFTLPLMPEEPAAPPAPPAHEPLPEARFEVRPDGSISAEVTDGPTQLHLTFPDEAAFQKDAPGLYQRYRATRERIQ